MFERIIHEMTGRLFRSLSVAAVCFFVSVFSAYAQKLDVDDFRELTGIDALLGDAVRDERNNQLAALIKVVSRENNFTFDCGSMGIVKVLKKEGEWWVYVPNGTRKLTIQHPVFGKLTEWPLPCVIEGGKTYQMLLNIGTGRYVTINSSRANANITIDGEYIGKAPIYYHYLNYGPHTIKAECDYFEGEEDVMVTVNDEKDRNISVKMQDMSAHYGDVHVTAQDGAVIIFEGQSVGTGEWRRRLREGTYTIKTALADCDTVETFFTVEPQKMNAVTAIPPVPHKGYFAIVTRTRDVNINIISNRKFDLSHNVVPVGEYTLEFSRKGFVSQTRSYKIEREKETRDTITLQRIEYVKKLSFYLGAGYCIAGLGGVSGILGSVIYNNDIQLSYTFGLNKTSNVNWYNNGTFLSSLNYHQSRIAVKYGYQFNLLRQLALTPQVGYAFHRLSGNLVEGSTTYGEGANAHAISIGLKILAVPFQHCYIFAAPEYIIAFKKSNTYTNISNQADFNPSHFAATIGVLANF